MAESSYSSFLKAKQAEIAACGFKPGRIHKALYPFQRALVRWAIRQGRAAVFADCGLGKTFIQLEWARLVLRKTGGRVLIVAPLCVAEQTKTEAVKLGIDVAKVNQPTDDPIQITNYERMAAFVDQDYSAVVLDESSILKSIDGKTRTLILREFTGIPYRLACTATPAPNDIAEMGNHAEFLGVSSRAEMLAAYFVHEESSHWRLKGHAQEAFYRWLASWSVFVRSPSDIGFEDAGFELPPLDIVQHVVPARLEGAPEDGFLFQIPLGGLAGRRQARKASLLDRVEKVKDLVQRNGKQWLVWCGLNAEGRELAARLDKSSVLVEGKNTQGQKIERERTWREGKVKVLTTKPTIFGFGMNWQHCANVVFLGLGDSWEQYYQAIRRTWRYGQKKPVRVHIVVSDLETNVLDNIRRKQTQADNMAKEVIDNMGDIEKANIRGAKKRLEKETTSVTRDPGGLWTMRLGDCVERMADIPDASVGLSVFSPPFASLYTYTDSPRDMGNSAGYEEFLAHYRYLLPELLRVTMPGRRCCTHLQQIALKKCIDGVIGWRDLRADVVRFMVEAGWIYDGEVVIDKCPQAQAIRTKAKALMFVQKNKDSSWCRPAMADYILLFRAPGENPEPVKTDVTNDEWIRWARPIWYGIRESDTLNFREARSEKDERHICPLQLGTIERCVRLWSNAGDVVFSPFAGIGSEGYVAVKWKRRFEGIELKQAYFNCAVRNLGAASARDLLSDYERKTP